MEGDNFDREVPVTGEGDLNGEFQRGRRVVQVQFELPSERVGAFLFESGEFAHHDEETPERTDGFGAA